MLLRALAPAWRGWSQRYKTLAGVVRNALRSMLAIQRATRKTSKNQARSFLNKGFCQERMKIRSWSAPGPILEGYGRLPGVSWAALGHSWGTLGRCGAPLGRILGAFLVLWGASWPPTAAQDGLGLNFSSILVGFWLHLGIHFGVRGWFLGRTLTSSCRIYMVREFLQETHIEIH